MVFGVCGFVYLSECPGSCGTHVVLLLPVLALVDGVAESCLQIVHLTLSAQQPLAGRVQVLLSPHEPGSKRCSLVKNSPRDTQLLQSGTTVIENVDPPYA